MLMGRNAVGDAARLNGICSHAHQLNGLEWSIGVATQGLLHRTLGAVRQERRIQQPASVREEWQKRLSDNNRRGVRHSIIMLIFGPASTIGQHGRLVTGSQPKS